MSNLSSDSPQVFIVDDESGVADLCADSLSSSYRVKVFNSAQAALNEFDRGERADVVLTDLKMPGMDGMEFVEHMRKQNVGSSVVMMSAFMDKNSTMRAMEHQIVSVVEKPFELSVIRNSVAKAIELQARDSVRKELFLAHQRLAQAALKLIALYRDRYTAAENQLFEADLLLHRGPEEVGAFLKEIRTETELENLIEHLSADINRMSRG